MRFFSQPDLPKYSYKVVYKLPFYPVIENASIYVFRF